METKLDQTKTQIESIEQKLNEQSSLKAERDDVADQLVDLRTKIDQIEQQAVEQFNEHMDAILNLLAYENLDRIWIERKEKEVHEGRQKVDKTVFELHIIPEY